MTHPPLGWKKRVLEGQIPGCNRLQICGLFARLCRNLQSYIVDLAMNPVQFEPVSTSLPCFLSLHDAQFCRLQNDCRLSSV